MNVNGEGFALQAHGLQAHVDQNFDAGFGDQAHGVAGIEHHINGCVTGGVNLSVSGLDGNAVAQHPFRKSGIGYFGDGHGLTGHRSADLLQLLTEQFIKKPHSILVPFLSGWLYLHITAFNAL